MRAHLHPNGGAPGPRALHRAMRECVAANESSCGMTERLSVRREEFVLAEEWRAQASAG
ncbi:hypothetical protein GCM10022286_03620 [Gryllotalpicola daejeonensis]|uniref:Uncharacterized protein n=1 Tax=Gryllotalpicola daejeonensis TaxID=993087 RepID=A0ABP7ZE98_9MICO